MPQSPFTVGHDGVLSSHYSVSAAAGAASRALRAGHPAVDVYYRQTHIITLTPADFERTRGCNQIPGASRVTLDTIVEDAIAAAGGMDEIERERQRRTLGKNQKKVRDVIAATLAAYATEVVVNGAETLHARAEELHEALRPYLK